MFKERTISATGKHRQKQAFAEEYAGVPLFLPVELGREGLK